MPLDTASACQARQALAALNAQIAEATAARDVAQRAHDRLAKPAAMLEEAVAAHAAEKASHDERRENRSARSWEREMEIPTIIERNRRIAEVMAECARLHGGGGAIAEAKYRFWSHALDEAAKYYCERAGCHVAPSALQDADR
jgi:hypothetical protein